MMIAAGVLLGFIGPYDTFSISHLSVRLSYWVSLLFIAALVSGYSARLILPTLIKKKKHQLLGTIWLSAIIALQVFPFVIAYDIIYGEMALKSHEDHLKHFLFTLRGLVDFFVWYGQVYIITFIVVIFCNLAESAIKNKNQNEQNAQIPARIAGQRFLKRLPANLGDELLCLTVEDHYVRVHTPLGNTLILMRFADALLELEEYEGMQVHRSWWVAINAVEKVSKDKRRHILILKNGMKVPVSQRYNEKIKESGLT